MSDPNADLYTTTHPWSEIIPDDVTWDQTIDPKPLFELLDDAVDRFPDNTCTNFLGKTQTYSDIASAVRHAASGLEKLGVTKGSKVGLFFPNCPSYVIYYFATLKLGGIVVNFNPLYTIEELEVQVKDSGTTVMVTLNLAVLFEKIETLLENSVLKQAVVCDFRKLLPSFKSVLFGVAKRKDLAHITSPSVREKVTYDRELRKNDGRYTSPPIDPIEDVAVLQYTGGTTGTPKGAMLTHANLWSNTFQIISWAPELEDGKQKIMAILPFFHVFGMTVVMNFAIGRASEIVLVPKFELEAALKTITKTRPTCMPGVPTLYNAIINHKNLEKYDVSSLQFCFSGGAPLPLSTKNQFEELTHCKLVEGYGLSESSPVVSCNPLPGPIKEGSIGIPLPGTVVSLRDLQDHSKEVTTGERGELVVSGPQIMKGYWNRPEETKNVFVGEYLRTGDVATMDNQGFIYIVDRIKDIILCSGFNVYPRQVEDAIYKHSAVEEVTVVAAPDEYRGEAPKAFVKLHKETKLTEDELLSFLKVKLSKIQMPREIEFRDELPKTLVGKLSKKELLEEQKNATNSAGTATPVENDPPR